MKYLLTTMFVLLCTSAMLFAQEKPTVEINIQVDKPGIKVAPSLYGIFFEEINLAGDGGIYPELVRNRSFEFREKTSYWTIGSNENGRGRMTAEPHDQGSEYNKTVLRVDARTQEGSFSVINEGYWGIPLEQGATYNLIMRAKGSDSVKQLTLSLESFDGKTVYATKELKVGDNWKTLTAEITSNATDPKARLAITTTESGTFWLDYVSLKPAKTYKGHGLRTDLMEMLAELKPAFVRFPGGCWVNGHTIEDAWRWKRTIGDPIDRWTQPNVWGYDSTNGLGYHEYLQMCEDLNADALLVVNCGMAHGFAHTSHIPMDQMDEWVQDALDAIEYATGPVTSKWGALRAKNGRPKPFTLKYIEIGNENVGPRYWERYDLFYAAIHEKYPDIHIIANEWRGQSPHTQPLDISDEHYYYSAAFFALNAKRYDSYDRNGPKIYVGEYASTRDGRGKGNLDAALGEAAFMTGMERNSDVVIMSSYAPLFVNVNNTPRTWDPNLINFDGTRAYGIPSYYVQQLFAVHRADVIVPTEIVANAPANQGGGKVGVGSWETQVEYKDAKIEKDGQVLFESNLAQAPEGAIRERGNWSFSNGVLRQTSMDSDCSYLFGDPNGNDYTFSVKGRKIQGNGGFFILFNVKGTGSQVALNLGGLSNSQTALQRMPGGDRGKLVDVKIDADRWYDIRIEVNGETAKCYLDGKMILEDRIPSSKLEPIYAVSGLNEKQDEAILKLVNFSEVPYAANIVLTGAKKLSSEASLIELTSKNGSDENTFDTPENVSPRNETISLTGPAIKRTLPAKSLTIIRAKIK